MEKQEKERRRGEMIESLEGEGRGSTGRLLRNISDLLGLSIQQQLSDLVRTIQGLAGLVGHAQAKAVFDQVLVKMGGSGSLTIHDTHDTHDTHKASTQKATTHKAKKKRRTLSPEGRANIIAAQRRRWAAKRTQQAKVAARKK